MIFLPRRTGILTVIITGWTTSNPTIYRAGLAFVSLNDNWGRTKVTAMTGVVTTVVACFPFVFRKLIDFVGLMGLVLVQMGTVIVTEHWLFPRWRLTRDWSTRESLPIKPRFRENCANGAGTLA